jgi:hypothetical protein
MSSRSSRASLVEVNLLGPFPAPCSHVSVTECRRRRCADLSGIEEVEKQRGWLQDMDSKIQGKAYEVLRDAVLKRQQADIGSALQVPPARAPPLP